MGFGFVTTTRGTLRRCAAGLAVVGIAMSFFSTGSHGAGAFSAELLPVAYSRPPAPDCGAMAARYGTQRLWFGAISATRLHAGFTDRTLPYYAEGCFLSEPTCRTWLHENLSFASGPLNWMRCQPGVPRRALR